MIYERNERGVLLAHRFPVDAVHRRREEKVAHVPPALEIDLFPFGVAIELHIEALDLELHVPCAALHQRGEASGLAIADPAETGAVDERNLRLEGARRQPWRLS